jgi:type V secretory pathway adhesin AidA
MAITITNILTIGGNTTFSGTGGGFTTKDYIQTVAGSTVTLKSGATYTVTGQLTITGTSSQRCTLKGSDTYTGTGTVSGNTLTTSAIVTLVPPTAPATYNYLMSQNEANVGVLKRPVAGMNVAPVTAVSSFPSVTAGSGTTSLTLSKSFTMGIPSRGIKIGLTAKFIHTAAGGDAARNINFVNTFDIDSVGSTQSPIKADNSYQNRIGIPNPNLWRTVNWDSLNPLTPLITIAYVE